MNPFAENTDQGTVGNIGEVALLRSIKSWLAETAPPAPRGMGDDCAVIPIENAGKLILTTDSLVYGKHFDSSIPPEAAGRKLMNRNLSDIAAMAGHPRQALVSLFLPPTTQLIWLQRFYEGMRDAARPYNVEIAGGDITSTTSELAGNIALYGVTDRPILRSTAEAGDSIWVTGALGGSICGKHHHFTPRVQEALSLAQIAGDSLHAMIDLTDGLAKDLPALLGEKFSAILDSSAIPLTAEAHSLSAKSGESALYHAFCDGEDYELLFTISANFPPEQLKASFQQHSTTELHCIGTIAPKSASPFIDLQTNQPITFNKSGYEHFR